MRREAKKVAAGAGWPRAGAADNIMGNVSMLRRVKHRRDTMGSPRANMV
jgi:hypothetical protein